jgi:hypothetical protein
LVVLSFSFSSFDIFSFSVLNIGTSFKLGFLNDLNDLLGRPNPDIRCQDDPGKAYEGMFYPLSMAMIEEVSSLTPGPMVDEMEALFK